MDNNLVEKVVESLSKDYVQELEALAQNLGKIIADENNYEYLSTHNNNHNNHYLDYLDSLEIETYIETEETTYLLGEDTYHQIKEKLLLINPNLDDEDSYDHNIIHQAIYDIYEDLDLIYLMQKSFYDQVERLEEEYKESLEER